MVPENTNMADPIDFYSADKIMKDNSQYFYDNNDEILNRENSMR